MSALACESSQRAVTDGDTVKLSFMGPGRLAEDPIEYEVRKNGATEHCWASRLIGKHPGDTVELPEKEGTIVHALIMAFV